MSIRLISDIHLEFQGFELPKLPTDSEDILVCAGDIGVGLQGADWISGMSDRFKAIIYVAGNHEFYKGNYTKRRKYLREYKWPKNVHYMDGDYAHIDEYTFIGATLWTDNDKGNPMFDIRVRRELNDYNYIDYDDEYGVQHILTPKVTGRLHEADKAKIAEYLLCCDESRKIVVVTHHLPSYACIHPNYRGSRLNPAYASSLDDLIFDYEPNLWVFGHSHKSCDITLGNTRLCGNPRGYFIDSRGENSEFDPYLRIEV